MATSIERVRRAFAQTPLLMLPEKAEEIWAFLELRADGHLTAEQIRAAAGQNRRPGTARAGGVAVLPVYGTISQRMDMLSEMSGGTSTESLGRAFDRFMADPEIGTIVLDVDSPGGTVPGVMELCDKIFRARGQGKRIIAVANSMAASAAYWIASAADELVVSPSGVVGSIGVYTIHTEYERALENAGVRATVIRAGAHKAEGNPYEKLSDEAREYAQGQINEIYDEFVQAVARNRSVTVAKVESGFGQGRVVKAKAAVAAGMADRVGTLEDVLAELGVARSRQQDGARAEADAPPVAAASVQADSLAVSAGSITGRWAGVENEPQVFAADGAAPEDNPSPITEPAPEAREQAMPEQEMAAQNGAATGATYTTSTTGSGPSVQVGADLRAERERSKAISELCEMHGIGAEASSYIESGVSVQEVVSQIHGRANANLQAMKASHVDLSEKEQKRYSMNRAILAAADRSANEKVRVDDGFEQEISEHIRSNLPQDYKSRGGFFAPMAVMNTGTAAAGGNTVFTQPGEFIDQLRNVMKVAELGASIFTGLEGGTIAFPKQTGGLTWTWTAENPGSNAPSSDMAYGQVLLAPKSGQSATAYTRQYLAQSSLDVEAETRRNMFLAAALGIDLAALAGNSATDPNSPDGILNTAGIGSVAIGANGGAPTYDHMVDLETAIAVDNADIGTMAYLSTPGVRGKLKKTQEFSGTNGKAVWTGGKEGEVNGYAAHVSNQVPSNLTKGTSTGVCHAIIYGVWSQLLIGYWGAAEVVVDPYSLKRQGLIEVSNFQMVGLAVRHAEAFSAIKDALTA